MFMNLGGYSQTKIKAVPNTHQMFSRSAGHGAFSVSSQCVHGIEDLGGQLHDVISIFSQGPLRIESVQIVVKRIFEIAQW